MKLKLLPLICALLIAYGISANAQVSENENAARAWITSHAKELKIKDGHTFKLNFVKKGLSGETLRFQQMVNEVPVFDSEIVIHFSPKREITSTSDTYDSTVANITTTPSVSKEKATADLLVSLGGSVLIFGRDKKDFNNAFDDIKKQFPDCELYGIPADVTKKEDIAAILKIVDKQLGGIQLFADKNWLSDFITSFGINSIPRFILIDPKGNVVNANADRPSSQQLVAVLDELLK